MANEAKKEKLELRDLHGERLVKVRRGETERLDHFQDVIQLTHPQIIIQETDCYYDMDTFNACGQNGTLLLTLDAWAEVHPYLVTLPVDWDYTVPYGILYAKEPTDEVTRFLQILHSILPASTDQ